MGMEYKKMSIQEKTKRIVEDIQQGKRMSAVSERKVSFLRPGWGAGM